MDYRKRAEHEVFAGQKRSLLMAFIAVAAAAATFIVPATSQHSYPALNTPPILYVPDRNWRISEKEQVGQVIARIRAEDAENDELVFGLEPHFHSNYATNEEDTGDESSNSRLPFHIDPVGGIVYLNESLVGRAGEDFFLYITVSDGQLTAKNEVFVNILGRATNKSSSRTHSSIKNAVHNISHFLPAFHQLPGVQSVRYQHHNNRPSNSLPPHGFAMRPSFFNLQRPNSGQQSATSELLPQWPFDDSAAESDSEEPPEKGNEYSNGEYSTAEYASLKPTQVTTNRTRLMPITSHHRVKNNGNSVKTTPGPVYTIPQDDAATHATNTIANSIKATTIPIITAACGLFAAAVALAAYIFRKHLCAIGKTLKKDSKEEMAKKSNQTILSSNLPDDSRNSMVMRHWNGPVAYGNRYVPWDREPNIMQQSLAPQIPVSVVDGTFDASSGGAFGNNAIGAGSIRNDVESQQDRWEFPRHRLKFFNILGEGAFGQVWRCEATDIDGIEGVMTVAVKTLKENASETEKNDLVSELRVMKSLEPHINVVRLLGCCTDKDPIFVIIEYVNLGKLQTYLRNSRAERHYGSTNDKSNLLTSADLTSFMYQVAKGMEYLTSRGIIHRDLAARNILISDDHICKVADFGFARDVITSKIYERKSDGKLPIRWMAIESLYDNIFSAKSDIWSFGILMWEIVTLGSTPYPGISAADVMRKIRDGHRLEKPEHCRRELYNIMYYCWSEDANERPNFAEILQMLDKLLHTEMDYIELERFPDHNYYNILNLSGEKL